MLYSSTPSCSYHALGRRLLKHIKHNQSITRKGNNGKYNLERKANKGNDNNNTNSPVNILQLELVDMSRWEFDNVSVTSASTLSDAWGEIGKMTHASEEEGGKDEEEVKEEEEVVAEKYGVVGRNGNTAVEHNTTPEASKQEGADALTQDKAAGTPRHLHGGKLNGKNGVSDYPQHYDGPNTAGWQNPSARRHMIICM